MSKNITSTQPNKAPIGNRYAFLAIFEAVNSNYNGSPDEDNLPRVDPFSGKGLVTNVCLKHKIRREVLLRHGDTSGHHMYIKSDTFLNEKDQLAYDALGITDKASLDAAKKNDPELSNKIRDFMCANFWDIRAFGGVMTLFSGAKLDCAAITGPVQLSMSQSVSPVYPQVMTITRSTVATEKEWKEKGNHTMGTQSVVPYGLFVCEGSVDACLAERTGFSEEDLEEFFDALENCFMHDKSAIRSQMRMRKLIVFRHDSKYGNAHDYELFERVKIEEKNPGKPASSYSDYNITLDFDNLPEGISVMERL